jgi:hypothetical protein
MILNIIFNPAVIFAQILTSITFYHNVLHEIDLNNVYAQAGQNTDEFFFAGNNLELDWEQCNVFCAAAHMDLFEPTTDMDVRTLFKAFETKNCWTQYYESLVSKIVVGLDQYPPVKSTKGTEIKMSFKKVPDNQAVTLVINDENEALFEQTAKNEKKKCICMKEKAFPKKKADLDRLVELKLRMLNNLDSSKTLTEMFKGQVAREMYKLQSIGNVTHLENILEGSLEVDAQAQILKIVNDQLNQLVLPISNLMKTVKSPSDMAHLESLYSRFHNLVHLLGPLVGNPLQNPISYLPWDKRDFFDPTILENQNPQMAMSENEDDLKYLLVELFGRDESKKLPLKLREVANFSTIDTSRDQFWRLTLWDFVLGGLWVLQCFTIVIPLVASLISDIKYQHQIRKLRNRGRRDSISGRPFEIRKLMTFKTKKTKSPRTFRPTKTKSYQLRHRQNSGSKDLEKLETTPKVKQLRVKARAPPVPVPVKKSAKDRGKSISDTTTVVTVVRNDDLPLYLADSLLSIE